jgi:hypothetical protein
MHFPDAARSPVAADLRQVTRCIVAQGRFRADHINATMFSDLLRISAGSVSARMQLMHVREASFRCHEKTRASHMYIWRDVRILAPPHVCIFPRASSWPRCKIRRELFMSLVRALAVLVFLFRFIMPLAILIENSNTSDVFLVLAFHLSRT